MGKSEWDEHVPGGQAGGRPGKWGDQPLQEIGKSREGRWRGTLEDSWDCDGWPQSGRRARQGQAREEPARWDVCGPVSYWSGLFQDCVLGSHAREGSPEGRLGLLDKALEGLGEKLRSSRELRTVLLKEEAGHVVPQQEFDTGLWSQSGPLGAVSLFPAPAGPEPVGRWGPRGGRETDEMVALEAAVP